MVVRPLRCPSRGVSDAFSGCLKSGSAQRPRVDEILIDEMSSWDKPRQVMIEFRDTARVGLSKEGMMELSREATTLSKPRAEST